MGIRVKKITKPLSASQEEERKKVSGNLIQTGPEPAFGAAAPVGSNKPVSPTPSATQQIKASEAAGQPRTSGFTGVGRYLQAASGSQLGQQISGKISQAGQEAQKTLQQATEQFRTGLGQQQKEAKEAFKDVSSTLSGIEQGQIGQPSAEAVRQYGLISSGQYGAQGGISELASESVKRKLQTASQLAQAGQTSSGREGLLRQSIGRTGKQYTGGQSALDAMLLGQQAQEFKKAERETAGIGQRLGLEQKRAEEQARQFGTEIQKAKEQITGKTSGLEKQIKSDITGQKEFYQKRISDIFEALQDDISKGEVSKENADLLKSLGLNVESIGPYGVNLAQLKGLIERKSAGNIDEITSATADQLKKLNALKLLSGQAPAFSETDLQKAGTIKPEDQLSFKKEGFQEIQKEQNRIINGVNEVVQILPDLVNNEWASYIKGSILKRDPITGGYTFDSIRNLRDQLQSRIDQGYPVPVARDAVNKLNNFLTLSSLKQLKIKKIDPIAGLVRDALTQALPTVSGEVATSKDPISRIDELVRQEVEGSGGQYTSLVGTPFEETVRQEVQTSLNEAKQPTIDAATKNLTSAIGNDRSFNLDIDPKTGYFTQSAIQNALITAQEAVNALRYENPQVAARYRNIINNLNNYMSVIYPPKPSLLAPPTVLSGGKNYQGEDQDQAIQAAALNRLIKDISRPVNK